MAVSGKDNGGGLVGKQRTAAAEDPVQVRGRESKFSLSAGEDRKGNGRCCRRRRRAPLAAVTVGAGGSRGHARARWAAARGSNARAPGASRSVSGRGSVARDPPTEIRSVGRSSGSGQRIYWPPAAVRGESGRSSATESRVGRSVEWRRAVH